MVKMYLESGRSFSQEEGGNTWTDTGGRSKTLSKTL